MRRYGQRHDRREIERERMPEWRMRERGKRGWSGDRGAKRKKEGEANLREESRKIVKTEGQEQRKRE